MGHQDAFLRPRLSARYRFSQGTLAGMWGKGRDAPVNEPAFAGGVGVIARSFSGR